ncbi:alpha/beta hydrolase [Halioxenophilus sp. WMMB6]|uniref:alpha/beta hydrolase n=1 Tax=Halioxenophilus sp. WMMB6 TaxID=3073815 RepID=UPI00295ED736|nr:alpha/beta hydrolase [Halioxenophilus sp. WMMB6]
MQSPEARRAILSLGTRLGPDVIDAVAKVYDAEQRTLVEQQPATAIDIAYGHHERHKLDIYCPNNAKGNSLPVVLFVHGGGFLKGDKGSVQHWHNTNVGRLCAQAGFVGVVINYRLAPANSWPAGGEDVAAAIGWIKNHIGEYSGDPNRLIVMGTSAGAVHLCTYLQLHPETSDIRGLVLLSGLYGFTPLDERDTYYYGAQELYKERRPLAAISNTALPLLVCCAEFDPARFQNEFIGLMQARLSIHSVIPRAAILSGHNHYSMAMHLGSSDRRLADEVISFVTETCS